MYSIAICDDEIFTCSAIEQALFEIAKNNEIEIDVDVFYTGDELYQQLYENQYYNIIFLDIELPKLSGIDVANYIRYTLKNEQTQIIYISSKSEYAMQLFKTRPMDFFVKPFGEQEVWNAFLQAKELIDKEDGDFEFRIKNMVYRVPFNEIMYFQSDERKVLLYTENKVLEFYEKLDAIEARISRAEFWRIHKSYLINYRFVTEYSYECLKMKNEIILSISQSKRKEIRNKLLNDRKERKHGYRIYN